MTKQMGQLYRVEMSEDNRANAKPAQFVFSGHDNDDHVIGFVHVMDYDASEMEICLFSPRVIPEVATKIVAEILSADQTTQMLKDALEINPNMRPYWAEVANGSAYEESVH